MSELVIAEGQTTWTEPQKAALVQMGVGDAPRGDIEVFFHQAQRAGLDPFSKQIYLIGRNTKQGNQWVKKYTIQTSIEGFRIIRDRQKDKPYRGHTEQWCGKDGVWREVWLEDQPPAAARVLVHIEGYEEPVPGIALWSEFAPYKDGKPQGQWSKMPALMLAKCAEALALRKAYPHDLSGLYVNEEMDQASAPSDRATVPAAVQPAPFTDEDVQRWVDQAASAGSVEDLGAIWAEAQKASALSADVDGVMLGQLLRNLKAAFESTPPVEDVEDAEVAEVVEDVEDEPITEWATVQPGEGGPQA